MYYITESACLWKRLAKLKHADASGVKLDAKLGRLLSGVSQPHPMVATLGV